MNEQIMTRPATEISQFSPDDVKNQITLIQKIMSDAMKEGEHYGIIPGCNKPSLLKPCGEIELDEHSKLLFHHDKWIKICRNCQKTELEKGNS